MVVQYGLKWVETTFSLEPRWTIDPKITDIEEELSNAPIPNHDFRVLFMAQGAFNKLYRIEYGDASLMMRVSLPVDPKFKTESEVATLHFMSQHGNIPVPKVVAHDSSCSNWIGFEWILMDFMPGKPLHERWRSIPWTAKETIVKNLVVHCASMYRNQFDTIGNMYPSPAVPDPGTPGIGRIVSMHFFWAEHIFQDVCRGPFRSSRDWIASRLSLTKTDSEEILQKSQVEDDREDITTTLKIINRLSHHLGGFFPSNEQERTMLIHDDLSQHNIMVDDDGRLTAVVDWECVSALPLWKACQYPAFLESRTREEQPFAEEYGQEDDGEPNESFWRHLRDYELTRLRKYFLAQMNQLECGWVEVFKSSQKQRDFDLAIQACDDPLSLRTINAWLDDVENNIQSLRSLEERWQ